MAKVIPFWFKVQLNSSEFSVQSSALVFKVQVQGSNLGMEEVSSLSIALCQLSILTLIPPYS